MTTPHHGPAAGAPGGMMAPSVFHILRVPTIARPWWRTDERSPNLVDHKVWTDCCCCRMPAGETESRFCATWDPPLSGLGCYQEEPYPWEPDRCPIEPEPPTGFYYEPTWETRCGEGFGCTVKPRKRCGRALREMMRHGP